jgi:centrosomal protein CEP104
VAVQSEHLLTECQYKKNYKKCLRCTEAVNINNQQENDFHFKAKQCSPLDVKRHKRCPLCHQNVSISEEEWKEHLMSVSGCAKNSRKQTHPQQQPIQAQPIQAQPIQQTIVTEPAHTARSRKESLQKK